MKTGDENVDRYVGKDGIVRIPVIVTRVTATIDGENGKEDLVAELIEPNEKEEQEETQQSNLPALRQQGMLGERNELVKDYWSKKNHFVESLKRRGEVVRAIDGIVGEMIAETDKLLGNEMVAAIRNDMVASTTISVKRIEGLQIAVKTLSERQKLSKELDIDVEHPQMEIVFNWFFDKIQEVMRRIELADEMSDMFFGTLAEVLDGWKVELKARIVETGNVASDNEG